MSEDQIELRLSEAQTPKLTDWNNEPSILDLKHDLTIAEQAHNEHIANIRRWRNLLEVKGEARPPKVKGRSSVQPKLIRRQAEWRYSALSEPFLGSHKLFKISPTTFEDQEGAKQNELVLNWQFRTKLNRVKFIDDYVRSNVDEGTVVARLGWKRVTKKVKETVPVFAYFEIQDEQQMQQFQEALELRENDPRTYNERATPELKAALEYYDETQTPVLAQQNGETQVDSIKVLDNKPTIEIMNLENFYPDPSCNGDLDKALFAIVTFETNYAELKKEGNRYKNLNHVNWDSNSPASEPNHETRTPITFQFRDRVRRKVVAYEYWGFYDIEGNGELVPIVCTWIGDTIIRLERNPFPDQKIPFVLVPYLPVKRELMGEPDAELLEDNQKILGAVTRGMIDLLGRSANSQQGFAKGMLDPLNRRKFDNGQDYEFNPTQNPQNMHIMHKYAEFPQSAFLMLNLQNQEAEALTGVKSFAGGMSGEAYGDVAAGIRGVLDAASKREMAILRRLAKGMIEIGMKIMAMNAVFLSEEEVVRVTNEQFVTIKREDLRGDFDLEVDISTAEVDNAKAQDLAFMLQTVGPKSDPGIMMMILSEIADLKRMPALAEKLRRWTPQLTPEQQEMQRLEIERLKLENAKIQSEIDFNNARAKQADTKGDLQNLEYVEQETGTKHARDMQKTQGQARGNQNLQVTKALTTPIKDGEKAPDLEAAIGFNEMSERLAEQDNISTPAPIVDFPPERVELGEEMIVPEEQYLETQTI